MKESRIRSPYLLTGIRVPVSAGTGEVLKKATDGMKRVGIDLSPLHLRLYKKSVDARRRDNICLECSVLVTADDGFSERTARVLERLGAKPLPDDRIAPIFGSEPIGARPMVIGMGPAGMFAALLLAENGYRPILIDRGGSVAERAKDVGRFRESALLDPESNIQFGAGGAGTFSDGKLLTRIKDPRCGFVLRTLAAHGAPESVLTEAKPHVGTDILRGVVDSILQKIESLGGTVIYRCRMDSMEKTADGTVKVHTTKGIFECGAVILAPGHSSRDTYRYLIGQNYPIEPKPISVGVRVEHLQSKIDEALYGGFAGHPNLGHAEYALSDTRGERGVYTFCMCPGGEVVAAASEEGHLVVNGMSNHARDGRNANAAVAVSIGVEDMEPVDGNRALGAIAFQRSIERAAYLAGGSDFCAPVMTMGDFLDGKRGTEPSAVLPTYRGGKVRVADFETVFPKFVTDGLRYGFRSFGKKLAGYDTPDAVLTAAETRTSAPLRILRNAEAMNVAGHDRVYPCGEGAGYAGGITSAAIDGIRSALALMARFARPRGND